MKLPSHCRIALMLPALLVLSAPVFPAPARAQFPLSGFNSASSVSGQFIVAGPPQISSFAVLPEFATNASLVRLEPALLAVTAERIKESLWRELGADPDAPWRGKIYFALHPAQSLDENAVIVSERFGGGWNYHVELPDVLSRTRFMRAMTGVLLLEYANRNAGPRSAEVPAWLADGLSLQLIEADWQETILSSPDKIVNGLAVSRTVSTQRGMDFLGGARLVLGDHPALTFGQLSWPSDTQLSGDDGGVYRASAQLFVHELLGLKNGPAHLRAMIETLPRYYNWQTAFQTAFRKNFPEALDLEKWWALQVVSFAAHSPGPAWTLSVSRDNLDEILSVPVEMRPSSNALPSHAEISLQAVIRNFDPARQASILQTKLRDLGLAQFRMAPQLAALTAGYRQALADYLGQGGRPAPTPWNKHAPASSKASASVTLKKLEALDARRRAVEAAIKPDFLEQ